MLWSHFLLLSEKSAWLDLSSLSEDWQRLEGKEAFCSASNYLVLLKPAHLQAHHHQPLRHIVSIHKGLWHLLWDLACCVLTHHRWPLTCWTCSWDLSSHFQCWWPLTLFSLVLHKHVSITAGLRHAGPAAAELMVSVRTPHSCH